MGPSHAARDLFWAINDGGNGPFLFAFGGDGRSRGRFFIARAKNRDWEGLDTFQGPDGPMILIADIGDNDRVHDLHTLYLVAEPRLDRAGSTVSPIVPVNRRIVFSYPDGRHDAEAVAVDPAENIILILTKRDNPPLLYEVPLFPESGDQPIIARKAGAVERIPGPTPVDLLQKYGLFRSHPTALDLSPDHRFALVLTYKDAYLFRRDKKEPWAVSLSGEPVPVFLPLPEAHTDLRQREAACFSSDGRAIYVTSEGIEAGLYRWNLTQ